LAFATPFIVYVVYRVVDSARVWFADRHWGSPLTAAFGTYAVVGSLVIALLVPSVGDLVGAAQNAPAHFRAKAQSAPTVPQVGYSVPGVVAPNEFADLRTLVGVLGGRRARVWDFSNSPADIYFFAQFKLLTRYYHVSPAIEPATQQDVVRELKRANPDVIVYNSTTGLTDWDGLPNMVRHYDVSAWILRNYRPAVSYAGFLLYVRKSTRVSSASLSSLRLSTPIDLSNLSNLSTLYTDSVGPCDWGYAPNFFAQHPARDSAAQLVALHELGQHVITDGRIAPTMSLGSPPVEVFMTEDGVRIGTGYLAPNLSAFVSGVGFGFEIDARTIQNRPVGKLVTWVQTANGEVGPVPGPGQRPVPDIGTIERQATVWEDQLNLPASADTFHWLELKTASGSPIRPDSFALSLVNEQTHGILFSTRTGAPRPFIVRLDNCSQWAALPGSTAILTHTQKEARLELRLRR
jgi:hypothetical protein